MPDMERIVYDESAPRQFAAHVDTESGFALGTDSESKFVAFILKGEHIVMTPEQARLIAADILKVADAVEKKSWPT